MSQMPNRSTKGRKEEGFLNTVGSFYSRVIIGDDIRTEEDKMVDIIRSAHEEWKNAESFFQNVTEPDLVDHAIYRMEAARTRYTYLMKQAREMGIRGNWQ